MEPMSDDTLSEIYAFAIQLGKDAGQVLQSATNKRLDEHSSEQEHEEKASSVDIVTQTDEGE